MIKTLQIDGKTYDIVSSYEKTGILDTSSINRPLPIAPLAPNGLIKIGFKGTRASILITQTDYSSQLKKMKATLNLTCCEKVTIPGNLIEFFV